MSKTDSTENQKLRFNFAGFLPECVRNALREMKNKKKMLPFCKQFSAIFLTCEISGIQECIDMYSLSNVHSTADVAEELHQHISAVMKRIVGERGDIIHLGDSNLECIWPVETENAHHLYRTVLNVALAVQKEFGVSKSRIGCPMQNKIGIADGDVDLLLVGSENCFYTIAGDVLEEAKNLLSTYSLKGVIATKSFWRKITNKYQYEYQESDENYVTVLSTSSSLLKMASISPEACFRSKPSSKSTAREINRFAPAFYKRVISKQQLQTLASLSQAVFVAVRAVDFDVSCAELLHHAANSFHDIVQKYEGIVIKVIYQRDPIFCIVHGLPGFQYRDDAVRGVLCARDLLKCSSDLGMKVSIGISSGVVFCGILGGASRQECCVLGMPARTALSLVDHCCDMEIVCDTNIYFRSFRSLGGEIFTPFRKRLKSLKTPKLFFEIYSTMMKKESPTAKCIGRNQEKAAIVKALKALKDNLKDLEDSIPLVNVTGDLGAGKSTLLNWSLQEGKKVGYRFTARVSNTSFEKASSNAWSILRQILACCAVDSESGILELLEPDAYRYPLHLLEREMNMSFRKPSMLQEDEDALEMMVKLVEKSVQDEPVLIAVDNAEHTGTDSWIFLGSLLANRAVVVVATFDSEFKCTVPYVKELIGGKYLGIDLGPVSGSELAALACHILNVDALHTEFLQFLQDESGGNAHRLQEILVLPLLQRHYCLVPLSSMPEEFLKENFAFAEFQTPTLRACDIVDHKSLSSLKIPKRPSGIVIDHTSGLLSEEQMLLRKCSLLRETFGWRILETICPEYSVDELARKLQNLIDKNILLPACEHWKMSGTSGNRKILLGEVSHEYCVHPLRFMSNFLKKIVHDSVPESQRQRLHLYFANLVWEETNPLCDACRKEGSERKIIQCQELFKQCKIPSVDFRLCQCSRLKTETLLEVEYHLEKGKEPETRRIRALLDAAEEGLNAGVVTQVEETLRKIQRLKISDEIQKQLDYEKIAVQRLRAQMKMSMGKPEDALRSLQPAMLDMNLVFPGDIESGLCKSKKNDCLSETEVYRCLFLGCRILTALGLHDKATRVGSMLENFLLREDQENLELVKVRTLYLKAVTKTKPGKSRERKIYRLISAIRRQCFKRLAELPVVSVEELRTILMTSATLVKVLFETDQLDACKDLGRKTFQLLKILNHPQLLVKTLFWLTLVYFRENNSKKCLEMISHMQDAYQQSGDPVSEVLYQTTLVKLLRESKISMDSKDQLKVGMDYEVRLYDVHCFHPKHSSKIFCLSSLMALWCMEQNLQVPFLMWYNQALNLEKDASLTNYWSLLGAIYLQTVKILKQQEKFFVLTKSEVAEFKKSFKKVIGNIQNRIKKFVPVLGDTVQEMETCLKNAIKECKILEN